MRKDPKVKRKLVEPVPHVSASHPHHGLLLLLLLCSHHDHGPLARTVVLAAAGHHAAGGVDGRASGHGLLG